MTAAPTGLACHMLRYSRHAFEPMFQRGIPPETIESLIRLGEIIATYPDDHPYPSYLMLGQHDGAPIHAVIAMDTETGICQVVTVYRPDPARWDAAFKTRKQP